MLFDTLVDQWRYVEGIVHQSEMNHTVLLTSTLPGPFAVASVSDMEAPELMVSVYGKSLTTLDNTAKDRPFTVFFSDPSGIVPQSISLRLNNTNIPASSYSSVPAGGDLRSITLSIYPERERQVDSLLVQCTDFAGNGAEKTFAYLPGTDLTIKSFSCHPNPFAARRRGDGTISKVRFAFLLTDIAHSVTLSIYTVSSKKIRTWSISELIGYQQVEWDGRDQGGHRIANGTYYAKLVVKNDRKKVKKIIRIAKLEGF
jgi:hypothetical protein